MTAAWRILHLGCPCLASPIMAGSTETRPPTKLPRCRSAAFSDREQVDKPASLDGKGRPGCHERPSYLDAWLSCAGSDEWAPEVGNSEPVNMIQGHSVPPREASEAARQRSRFADNRPNSNQRRAQSPQAGAWCPASSPSTCSRPLIWAAL